MSVTAATDLYQKTVLDHNRAPRNYGSLAACTSLAEGFNPICGDRVTIQIAKQGDQVLAMFTAQSCALCKASASIMTEVVHGMDKTEVGSTIDGFLRMLAGEGADVPDAAAVFSVVRDFPARAKCVMLPWTTLKDALAKEP